MGEARVTRKRIKELYYIIKKIYLVEYVRCVLTLAWNALPNALTAEKFPVGMTIMFCRIPLIHPFLSTHLLTYYIFLVWIKSFHSGDEMQTGLLMRHLDLKCAVRHNRSSPFTVYRPFETMQRCSSSRTKEENDNPVLSSLFSEGFWGGSTSFLKSGDNVISNVIHCRREGGSTDAL